MFFCLLKQIYFREYKSRYLYLILTLDLHNPCVVSSLSWVTKFQGLICLCLCCPRAHQALDHPCCTWACQALNYLHHTRAYQAPDYFYKSTSYFWRTLCLFTSTVCDTCITHNMCLPQGKPYAIKVHFCAMHGYAATHMHTPHVYASLPFCHHHAIASWLIYLNMPSSDSIDRFDTNMYI